VGLGIRFLVLGFAGPGIPVVVGDLAEVDGSTIVVSSLELGVDSDGPGGSSRFCQYDRSTGAMSVAGAVAATEMVLAAFGATSLCSILLLLLVRA